MRSSANRNMHIVFGSVQGDSEEQPGDAWDATVPCEVGCDAGEVGEFEDSGDAHATNTKNTKTERIMSGTYHLRVVDE